MSTTAADLASSAQTGTAIDVSVVVPTYRRDELLGRLLEKLCEQDYAPGRFEIVVVDDARSKTVPAVVAAVAARRPAIAMKLLPGKGRGPATARNIGWRGASGRVIAFIDDDAYPANSHWLCEGLEPFADPEVVGVSGSVVVPLPDRPTDFQRNVGRLQGQPFLTCDVFYRRDVLEQVGGFDERFTVPFREDSDLRYRMEATGGKMVEAPSAVVVHPAPPGRFAISLRLQRYSMMNALLYKKHRRRFQQQADSRPPLHYYAMLACLLGGLLSLLRGRRGASRALLAGWGLLELHFFSRRARGTSRQPLHLLDLALTSLLIPPLSVYWRLRGAVRFRVFFF